MGAIKSAWLRYGSSDSFSACCRSMQNLARTSSLRARNAPGRKERARGRDSKQNIATYTSANTQKRTFKLNYAKKKRKGKLRKKEKR